MVRILSLGLLLLLLRDEEASIGHVAEDIHVDHKRPRRMARGHASMEIGRGDFLLAFTKFSISIF